MARQGTVVSWNDYFMNVARLTKSRSKDPSCQVGACITSKDSRIVGVGYNCMPRGKDDIFNVWDNKNEKLKYVCHAELNAIVNSDRNDFTDCKMYVTRIPCRECAKVIIQSNIKEVFYEPGKMDTVTVTMFEALKAEGFQLKEFEATNPAHMIVID